eukprot:870805-Pelagomonas_calceolata.AAC.1
MMKVEYPRSPFWPQITPKGPTAPLWDHYSIPECCRSCLSEDAKVENVAGYLRKEHAKNRQFYASADPSGKLPTCFPPCPPLQARLASAATTAEAAMGGTAGRSQGAKVEEALADEDTHGW